MELKDSVKSASEATLFTSATFISSTSFIGVPWQDWVYIVTFVLTVLNILWFMVRKFPKLITCMSCLWKNHKCDNACKIAPSNE